MLPVIQAIMIFATLLVSVSAGTIRFYPNPGCMGPSVQCSGIKPGACCSVGNVYATVELLDTVDGTITAWSNGECCGAKYGSIIAGKCLAPNFAVMSAAYSTITSDDRRTDLITSNSTSSKNYIPSASFAFMDENNVEQVFIIPGDQPSTHCGGIAT